MSRALALRPRFRANALPWLGGPGCRLPSGTPWEFGAPCFQDTPSNGDAPPAAAEVTAGAHLLGFSDEILLHILSHVPSTDLVVNVRRTCRKLAELCLDKSLTHTVLLQKDYEVRRRRGRGWAWDGERLRCPPVQRGAVQLRVGGGCADSRLGQPPRYSSDKNQGPKSIGRVPPGGGCRCQGRRAGGPRPKRET